MDKLKIGAAGLVLAALCFLAGKYSSPAKVQIKEVEKIVYKESSETKKNITKKETIKPDGTRTIETVINSDKQTNKSSETDKSKESLTENRPSWHVSLSYQPSIQSYSVDIQKRLFSELYLGAFVSTQQTYGISIGLGF